MLEWLLFYAFFMRVNATLVDEIHYTSLYGSEYCPVLLTASTTHLGFNESDDNKHYRNQLHSVLMQAKIGLKKEE